MRGSHPREFWARPSSCPLTPWGVIGGSLRASGQLYLASFCPPWSCLPQSLYLPLRSDDPVSFASESAKRHPDHKWHDKVLDPFYWNLPKLCSESPEPSTAPLDVFFRPICMRFLPAFFFFLSWECLPTALLTLQNTQRSWVSTVILSCSLCAVITQTHSYSWHSHWEEWSL